MRILFYGESPVVVTGLAQVSRTIVDALVEDGHEVEIVGMNHFISDYDRSIYPYEVERCADGDPNNYKVALDRIKNSQYDAFFCSTDFGRDIEVFNALIEERQKRPFLIIGYYAVDCDIIPPSTFDTLSYCNAKIVYTKHAKGVIERLRPEFHDLVNVVYLATEPDTFYPLSPEERRAARRELFNIEDDNTFLCLSINRNQARKDLGRLMSIFHEFHKSYPNSMLYMHAQRDDVGGQLFPMSQSLGMGSSLDNAEVIFTGTNFNVLAGYSRETMNRIYNAADCLLSASTGEGWGLSSSESMCAGTPVIVPRNTAFTEIVGEDEERGYLVRTGGDIDHQMFLYGL
jgi:glycosyltransferase involved in cell wall biosynthesis